MSQLCIALRLVCVCSCFVKLAKKMYKYILKDLTCFCYSSMVTRCPICGNDMPNML